MGLTGVASGRRGQAGEGPEPRETLAHGSSARAHELGALRAEVARLKREVAELEAGRERAAQATLEVLGQFAATTAGWFWEMDAELRFTYMSPSVENITGVTPEWHYGKTREEIGLPESVSPESWNAHMAVLRAHEPFKDFVFRRDGPDGAKWMKTSGMPVFDAQGCFAGYRGTAVDITAEFTARRTAERLLAAIENLNELFALWDADDRLVMCNARFREINAAVSETTEPGTRFEDHIRAALAAGLYPQAVGREEAWLEERFARHREPGAPIELERQGGRWLLVREHRLADRSTATTSTDITKRKHAEQALEKQHGVLDAAFSTIPDGVQVLDGDLKLAAWNPRLWAVLELDEAAILGSPDPAKAFRYALASRGEYGPGDVNELVASREAIARTGEPVRYERQLVSGKWIECRGTPLPGGGYLALYRDIDRSRRLQGELERLACADELTGLANRRHLTETMAREFARAQRYGTPVSVMIIDVDHFKSVNDRHGHAAGDRVLRQLAQTLASSLRDVDTVGRLGGEEFAAVLPESPLDAARVAADRARRAAAALRIEHGDAVISPTVSIGVTQVHARGDTVEQALARADQALYAAKNAGRDRVEIAHAP